MNSGIKNLLPFFLIAIISSTSCNRFCLQIISQLKKFDAYDEVGIAAILGNIDVQTGGSFDYKQKQYLGGPGYGIFQYDGVKKQEYFKFIERNKLVDSIKHQLLFMHQTIFGSLQDIVGRGNCQSIRAGLNSKDVRKATQIFCHKWQIPNPQKQHLNRRISSAEFFLQIMKSGQL